ncbi:hypothetical protein PF010_g5928 [Phytophthora fragariae]|uniref:Uncharacterized protein n=1 Tax=Phytophthora fragariae TaxID=53985 RepID=A0A6G0LN96_9STRA|nr:hypothetical protein PF010_g5928 [Phytophthora fragariae]KAE9239243.1 hypothetical protein PF004_g8040 [Phytophthora fragariae]
MVRTIPVVFGLLLLAVLPAESSPERFLQSTQGKCARRICTATGGGSTSEDCNTLCNRVGDGNSMSECGQSCSCTTDTSVSAQLCSTSCQYT